MTGGIATRPDAQWVTLGTCGGPFPQAEAAQISNALVVDGDVYLFDVGNGVLRQLAAAGIDRSRIRAVFLTHHHPDHIADLGIVMLTSWLTRSPTSERLAIAGPVGTQELVEGLAGAHRHTELIEGPAKPSIIDGVAVRVAASGHDGLSELYRDEHVRVSAVDVEHFRSPDGTGFRSQALGLRVETSHRTFAYTGDTGPAPALAVLAQGVDLLVSEIVDLPRIQDDLRTRFAHLPGVAERVGFNMAHNHLSAEEIARIAREAQVAEVVLTHFVPFLDATEAEAVADLVRALAPGVTVHAARDLARY